MVISNAIKNVGAEDMGETTLVNEIEFTHMLDNGAGKTLSEEKSEEEKSLEQAFLYCFSYAQ